ncbi:MAG: hypothetical protein AAF846_20920 [Chloroflexota bacterium]
MTNNQRPNTNYQIRTTIYHWWQTYFLLRWIVANLLGWILGLTMLTVILWLFGGFGSLFIGAGLGLGIGLPQAWILFTPHEMPRRRKWIIYSVVGGFFAVFPVGALAVIALFNVWLAGVLIGLAFGGILGLMQSFVFTSLLGDEAYYWILVSIVASILASLAMVVTFYLPLPIIASPATILYALITGWQLQKWMNI